MKSKFRNFVLMAAAGATADPSTGSAGAAPASNAAGAAPASNAAGAEKKARAPRDPANKLNIINGRLPMPLVYLIRFKEKDKPVAETAKRYGTSVGKVFDINKGNNFGYVTETYKPSAEEVAAANAWITTGKTAKGQSLKEAGGDPDGIKTMLDGLGVATADEVAKRDWKTRVVGERKAPAAGTAPVAAAEGDKGKTKLFP